MTWVLVRQGVAYEMEGKYFISETPLSTTIGGDTVIKTPLGINVVLNDEAPAPLAKPTNGGIPQSAIALIKEFEGCELTAYDDGVGVATIGFGSTFYPDGSPVQLGQTITQKQADDMLAFQLKKFWDGLKNTPYWADMLDGQRGALLSFSFNTGWTCGEDGFNTLNAAIKGKHWDAVPQALMLYVNPGTSTEAGLRRRREAEGKLWKN